MRYRRHFGEDFWLADAERWMLAGVNAQLLGSGLAAEAAQWAWLASLPVRTAGRPLALFIHKPLFERDPDETEVNLRYVPPDQRRRLREALERADLRLVAERH